MRTRRAIGWSGIAGGAIALLPTLAHAQQVGGGSPLSVPIVKLVLGLLVCAFAALIAALALKRFAQGGAALNGDKPTLRGLIRAPARRVRILETHRVSPHADLCCLSYRDREYLIVFSPGAAILLRETAVNEPKALV